MKKFIILFPIVLLSLGFYNLLKTERLNNTYKVSIVQKALADQEGTQWEDDDVRDCVLCDGYWYYDFLLGGYRCNGTMSDGHVNHCKDSEVETSCSRYDCREDPE